MWANEIQNVRGCECLGVEKEDNVKIRGGDETITLRLKCDKTLLKSEAL